MAKQKKKAPEASAKLEAALSPALSVRPQSALLHFAQGALQDLQGAWDEDKVKTLLSDLAGRKRSIESVLLEVADSAKQAVQKSLKQARKASQDDQRLNQQYREQLSSLKGKPKRSRATKGEVRVSGHVLHPKTAKPVPGVVVEAIDKDVSKHDVLGSVLTNAQGKFTITFRTKDYKESGENEPEILLRVGWDRRNLRYVWEEPLAWAEVEKGDISITLPEDIASSIDALRIAEAAQHTDTRIRWANQAVFKHDLEDKLLNNMGDSASELLDAGITLLKGRMKRPAG